MLKITPDEVEFAIERFLEQLKDAGYKSFELKYDYFWCLDGEASFNIDDRPTEWLVGQLSDNWSYLQEMTNGDEAIIGYAFVWFGEILQAIAETV